MKKQTYNKFKRIFQNATLAIYFILVAGLAGNFDTNTITKKEHIILLLIFSLFIIPRAIIIIIKQLRRDGLI